MMFLTSCEVGFFIFILVCLEITICVMYVSTYSLCLIYVYVMKVRNPGRITLIMHLYHMFYYLIYFTTSRYLQNCLKNCYKQIYKTRTEQMLDSDYQCLRHYGCIHLVKHEHLTRDGFRNDVCKLPTWNTSPVC